MIAFPSMSPPMIANVVLVLLVLGFIGAGLRDGLVYTLGRLVGAVLGYVLARMWSPALAVYLASVMPSPWAKLVAFFGVFFLVGRIVGFLFKLLDGVFRILALIPFLSSLNQLLGAVLGALEGIILVGGLVWIFGKYHPVPSWSAALQGSYVANGLVSAFHVVTRIFSPLTDLVS